MRDTNHSKHRKLRRRKRRIQKRLRARRWCNQTRPMFTARNIHYDVAERTRAMNCGGIGAVHLLAHRCGLIEALDRNVRVLKVHLPYHESDHVLSFAYNILTGGSCIEDLERLRTNEVYLDALGAGRIPDPTTAGDFCRRFTRDEQILTLMETINQVRLGVWKQQDEGFFQQAILDADGTMAPTYGQCKQGMDISYDGQWGYHPLVISLANTKEPLYLVNRSGNRPSHEQADAYLDRAITLCRRAGFKQILLRGDTDFLQTWKLDGWDDAGDVRFYFGADARREMIGRAEALEEAEWRPLERPDRYEVKTHQRSKPPNVKEQIVRAKQFKNLVLLGEQVAEFAHRPDRCRRSYRMVVLRKKISVEKGQAKLFEEYRYLFYLTNDRVSTPQQVVFQANDRCDQENLIEQLKNGVKAMANPVDNLHSNWAYMVMSSLAWTLKAWCGLLLPADKGRWHQRYQAQRQAIVSMEFKRFADSLICLPCQILKAGRRIVYRLLSWNPWATVLLRLAERLRTLRSLRTLRPMPPTSASGVPATPTLLPMRC